MNLIFPFFLLLPFLVLSSFLLAPYTIVMKILVSGNRSQLFIKSRPSSKLERWYLFCGTHIKILVKTPSSSCCSLKVYVYIIGFYLVRFSFYFAFYNFSELFFLLVHYYKHYENTFPILQYNYLFIPSLYNIVSFT